jgi:hypothetical protein
MNPVDVGTRGIFPLTEEQWILWEKGPGFLRTGDWPVQPQLGPAQLEVKAELNVALAVGSDAAGLPMKAENISSCEKLLKTKGYVYRW